MNFQRPLQADELLRKWFDMGVLEWPGDTTTPKRSVPKADLSFIKQMVQKRHMSFGMRLRREFQESASGGKHIYPKLASLTVPPEIMVSFFPSTNVEKTVQASGMNLSGYQAIEILETVLIQAYLPDFQRHHINRTLSYLKKLAYLATR